jgi:hypothetical protein
MHRGLAGKISNTILKMAIRFSSNPTGRTASSIGKLTPKESSSGTVQWVKDANRALFVDEAGAGIGPGGNGYARVYVTGSLGLQGCDLTRFSAPQRVSGGGEKDKRDLLICRVWQGGFLIKA